ncbi:MAG: UDP-N-acetylmuramate--L-alanine ligase [Phycisphaerae bacterium]|nr:UDP-N-acetylmuramate--L-alanine ligase [Phycisphaerae bacterium]
MDTEKQTDSGSQADENVYLGKAIHFIGIGGSGMRALAWILMDRGAVISGSDSAPSDTSDQLVGQGATIHIGQRGENIPDPCDLVVYSAAVNEQNPELIAARRRSLEVVKYSEMLGRLMNAKAGLAIAGTHGKSTTSAMVAYVMSAAMMDPSFVVGASVEQLGGPSGVGDGKHFVAEACEFDRSFLYLHPQCAAILNIEEDHLDCFSDINAIIEAFRAFASGVKSDGVIIANGEDRNAMEAVRDIACGVETFGLCEECNWRGVIVNPERGRIHMEILKDSQPYGELLVPLPGLHNAYNVLAAVAMLHHAGLDSAQITGHLAAFTGIERRLSLKGQLGGATVVDDFAHHPTEIQASLRAISNYYQPRRIFCVFQPHQHSRTRFLLKDFAQSFALADEVIVPDIYFVRDSEKEKDYISSKDLVAQIRLRGGVAIYLKTFDLIVEYIKGVFEPGDLIVTMGAGNIWKVADEIIRWLERKD